MRERYSVEDIGPVRTTKVGLCLETSDGVPVVSLPQHDGKGLVVLPTSSQVDMGVQEVTAGRREGKRETIIKKSPPQPIYPPVSSSD